MLCSCHDCVITNSHGKKQQLTKTNNNTESENDAETTTEEIKSLADFEKYFMIMILLIVLYNHLKIFLQNKKNS